VEKVSGGVTTVYVYDAKGEVAAEYSTSPATPTETQYLTGDHLGSTRLVTNAAGTVLGYHDYLPFGEEISAGIDGRSSLWGPLDGDGLTQKFTAKERDAETGSSSATQALDYSGARYYSSSQGRFTSVDPVWVKADRMLDPQRLNLYAYGRNNPLRFSDPTGMDVTIGKCASNMTVSMCEAAVTNGLQKGDRAHVHFVKGDGKNGFDKGVLGVMVDADYKSQSKNFQILQSEANDHSATARIDILNPTDTFNVRESTSFSATGGLGKLETMSMTAGPPQMRVVSRAIPSFLTGRTYRGHIPRETLRMS
jgi:RHS repeat-associated protein